MSRTMTARSPGAKAIVAKGERDTIDKLSAAEIDRTCCTRVKQLKEFEVIVVCHPGHVFS